MEITLRLSYFRVRLVPPAYEWVGVRVDRQHGVALVNPAGRLVDPCVPQPSPSILPPLHFHQSAESCIPIKRLR